MDSSGSISIVSFFSIAFAMPALSLILAMKAFIGKAIVWGGIIFFFNNCIFIGY